MIALKDDLPLIGLENGEIVLFEREWPLRSLLQAAQKAGYRQWWLAGHVVESVTLYLRVGFDENVLGVQRLREKVQSVLQVIGYADVARQFVPGTPPAHISLLDLAREAGHGYELAFFDALGRRLHDLVRSQT